MTYVCSRDVARRSTLQNSIPSSDETRSKRYFSGARKRGKERLWLAASASAPARTADGTELLQNEKYSRSSYTTIQEAIARIDVLLVVIYKKNPF